MKYESYPKGRTENILTQEIAGETLVYDLEKNRAYCLNSTSSQIWALSDGTRTVPEITEEASKTLGSSVTEDLVHLALDEFGNNALLAQGAKLDDLSVSRREAIRKVALTSAVALPLVSALVVPNAVEAQSCIADSQPCLIATPPPCCAGTCLPTGSNAPGEPGICVIV